MNNRIKLNKKQVLPLLNASFPDYTGRKFSVEFTENLTFWDTNWHGGTHREYIAIDINGNSSKLDVPAPWNNPIEGLKIVMPKNAIIACHLYFCGYDMGITFYSHPSNAPKLLTA